MLQPLLHLATHTASHKQVHTKALSVVLAQPPQSRQRTGPVSSRLQTPTATHLFQNSSPASAKCTIAVQCSWTVPAFKTCWDLYRHVTRALHVFMQANCSLQNTWCGPQARGQAAPAPGDDQACAAVTQQELHACGGDYEPPIKPGASCMQHMPWPPEHGQATPSVRASVLLRQAAGHCAVLAAPVPPSIRITIHAHVDSSA